MGIDPFPYSTQVTENTMPNHKPMNLKMFVLAVGVSSTIVLVTLNWMPPPFYRQTSLLDFIVSWISFAAFYFLMSFLSKK